MDRAWFKNLPDNLANSTKDPFPLRSCLEMSTASSMALMASLKDTAYLLNAAEFSLWRDSMVGAYLSFNKRRFSSVMAREAIALFFYLLAVLMIAVESLTTSVASAISVTL